MAAGERVRVPALLSRETTMWLAVGAAVVGVVAVLAWVGATQPENLPFVVAAAVLVVLGVVALVGRRTWLDVQHGTVVRETCFVPRGPVGWADAERVAFVNNRAGQVLLEVRGAGRRSSLYLPLVAVDVGGDRSQDPAFLRTLADQVERWAPRRDSVVAGLRAQAEHGESGGSVRTSPLARRYLASGRRTASS
ncbi:hypothetical protein GON03_10200 [Nocardioides sp. MAH-18]|uniref:PH domain-containing protein n=1 Tax=Nocardioides agri TaxID=2682843 RepID=A0A6L6XQC8_9ACTN|nr:MULTISPECIES: hypothetical protein [unclassified Nocardioides]MBA2954695.1 hypothetical protein [Nocardioides sp. CGMCC 1.13656]MVQ49551.1 hypothetical protein [Nocardioides sp. MAH-18]